MANYWDKVTSNRVARRRVLRSGAALSVGAAALALVGCGDDAPADDTGGAAATTAPSDQEEATGIGFTPSSGSAQSGGRFVFTWETNESFNPVSSWGEGTWLGGQHVYDRPLTSREDERRFVLEAMENIETPDPLTVIMKLKANQTFHDFSPVNGRSLTAEDVVATQEYVTGQTDAFDKVFVRDFLERAEATDDLTVVYHLKKPSAYLFGSSMLGSGTGQPIVPQETFDNLDTGKQVGSGPYFLDEAQLAVDYVYKKNPRFRESNLPYVDEREVKFIPDLAAQEAAFLSGQVHYLRRPTPVQFKTVTGAMGDQALGIRSPGLRNFLNHMNMTRNLPWQLDVRVREALWRLTDRQQVLDLAHDGEGIVPIGILPAALTEYQMDPGVVEPFFKEDVEKAKQLLTAANFDFDREFDILGGISGSTWEDSSKVLKEQWARAGIKTFISTVAGSAQLFQRESDNDWEIEVGGSPGNDTPSRALRIQHSDSWTDVYKGFALMDPEIDALIEESEITLDHEENVKLVKEVQLLCIQRFTSCYQIMTPNKLTLLNSKVQNFELTNVAPTYQLGMWIKE